MANDIGCHDFDTHAPEADALAREVYELAFFTRDQRISYRSDGSPARWGLDLRRPLSNGRILQRVCALMATRIEEAGLSQLAGTGIAAAFLVSGVLVLRPTWSGALIRSHRKEHGFREIVEGSLSREHGVALIDDILASGKTLQRASEVLRDEGHKPAAVIPFFRFGWYRQDRLALPTYPITTLHYRSSGPGEQPRVIWECHDQGPVRWEVENSEVLERGS